MNVFNPSSATHELKIIPRFYPDGEVILTLKNEGNSQIINKTIDPVIQGGYMILGFAETLVDNSRFQVTIKVLDEVVYRGRIFVTNQAADTQAYKISNDVFIYGD